MGADSSAASTAEWNDAKVMNYRTAKALLDGDTPTTQESLRLQCEITGNYDPALGAWAETLDRLDDRQWEGEIAHLVVKEGIPTLMSERMASWERDYNERVVEQFNDPAQGNLFEIETKPRPNLYVKI